jgi:DNA-binding response OmpR family regulator
MDQYATDRRILLVEDNVDTSRVMKKLLERVGYGVLTADGVAAALQASERETYHLVISDVGLPDGSGLDLIRQLLAKYPVKAIALSGYDVEEEIRNGNHDGTVEHLVKPVDMQQLEAAIKRLLA